MHENNNQSFTLVENIHYSEEHINNESLRTVKIFMKN